MYVGIDLGGTNIAAGFVDAKGCLVLKDSIKTGAHRAAEAIVSDMADLVRRLALKAEVDLSSLEGIGIGTPGVVDSARGVVSHASNLPFSDFPLAKKMTEALGRQVHIENDANCAAYAESLFGAARGVEHSVLMTIGTGIGGGLLIGRAVYTGHASGAGEIGHMVIRFGGRPCPCGRRGCFEAYASATGLIETTYEEAAKDPSSLLHSLSKEQISGRTAFEYARCGDRAAIRARERYIADLSCGIGNLIRILYPDVVVIGGGVSHEGDDLFVPLRKALTEDLAFDYGTKILPAMLGNDAGIIGAAMLGGGNRL